MKARVYRRVGIDQQETQAFSLVLGMRGAFKRKKDMLQAPAEGNDRREKIEERGEALFNREKAEERGRHIYSDKF